MLDVHGLAAAETLSGGSLPEGVRLWPRRPIWFGQHQRRCQRRSL